MARLAAAEVDRRLERLDGWERKGKFITKTFKFKTFMDGIAFVNELAAIAEKQEHHPDIHIRWTTIWVEIQTHDEGGITPYDIDLATEIEKHMRGKQERKARPAKR